MSIDDLACHLCIGCSLSLIDKGTKLCVITITDIIFGTSYFLTGIVSFHVDVTKNKKIQESNPLIIIPLMLSIIC